MRLTTQMASHTSTLLIFGGQAMDPEGKQSTTLLDLGDEKTLQVTQHPLEGCKTAFNVDIIVVDIAKNTSNLVTIIIRSTKAFNTAEALATDGASSFAPDYRAVPVFRLPDFPNIDKPEKPEEYSFGRGKCAESLSPRNNNGINSVREWVTEFIKRILHDSAEPTEAIDQLEKLIRNVAA